MKKNHLLPFLSKLFVLLLKFAVAASINIFAPF